MAAWVLGILMSSVAYLGLVMAGHAKDDTFGWVGILFFLTGVAFVYTQIVRNVGNKSD